MAISAFTEKSQPPSVEQVRETLGAAAPLWEALCAHLAERFPPASAVWKFYSKKSGWTRVMKQKSRTLLYLTPQAGQFSVVFVFGERAVAAAEASDLPPAVRRAISAAHAYVEGRSFAVVVATPDNLECVQKLAVIKSAN